MSKGLAELVAKLREMFQLDHGDLDFGIYRIMNHRRDEIAAFLERELPARVESVLDACGVVDGDPVLEDRLAAKERACRELNIDPEANPEVQDLRRQLSRARSRTAAEDEIYSHLLAFFSRYYDEGDFIAQRRAKNGAYLIPYEGQEVKLHWATRDQYYIKSSESFTNYAFTLDDGRRVRFRTVQAETGTDNARAANDKARRFLLHPDQPVAVEDGDLIVRFVFRADEERRKQEVINREIAESLLAHAAAAEWQAGLSRPDPRDAAGGRDDRRVIDRHLTRFAAKNTFDYFIHKDLKRFLTRELDRYIKEEVLSLDALEAAARGENQAVLRAALARSQAMRTIAHTVIDFLASLEEFQKRLWLKKKFVIETQWCVTLDRVDPSFYPEIAANDAQRKEWVELFAIDELAGDLAGAVPYSDPLTVEFLKANPFLVLDTRHFGAAFKDRLVEALSAEGDLDARMDGLFVNSENFHALSLLKERYRSSVSCIFIDPPYNTGSDNFIYKDSYQRSSWATMMLDRLGLSVEFLSELGSIFISIGEDEVHRLKDIADMVFGGGNFIASNIWIKNFSPKNTAKFFSVDHDYVLVYARNSENWRPILLPRSAEADARYTNPDNDPRGPWASSDLTARNYYSEGTYEVVSPNGEKFRPTMGTYWRVSKENFGIIDQENRIWWGASGGNMPRQKRFLSEVKQGIVPQTIWHHSEVGHTQDAKRQLLSIVNFKRAEDVLNTVKPIELIAHSIKIACRGVNEDIILDFFAGSGSTAHAVIHANHNDSGKRKFLIVEQESYEDKITRKRLARSIYSPEWRDGKPALVARRGYAFKYIRLESYEDALDNLRLERTRAQADFLASLRDEGGRPHAMRIEYLLSRMLETETRGSPSLLNLDRFREPDRYELRIIRDGEEKTVTVDLVETFNFLIGLTVHAISAPKRFKADFEPSDEGRLCVPKRKLRADPDGPWWFRTVEGRLPDGRSALVVWRNRTDDAEKDNAVLEHWVQRVQLGSRETEYDVIWVNGDHTLANPRAMGEDEDDDAPVPESGDAAPDEVRAAQPGKVRLIEQDFHALMFADADGDRLL